MKQPRLLFVDQYGSIGGGQTVLLSLLRAARNIGALTVLAPLGELQNAVRDQEGSAVVYHVCREPHLTHGGKKSRDVIAALVAIVGFMRHLSLLRQQDVIYVNGLRHLPAMLLLSPLLKARIIYHVHLDHSRTEKTLIRLAARLRQTFAVVTNSRFVHDRLGADKCVLIENALDHRFASLPFTDRFTGRKLARIAVCGTLRPEKGQDIAIAALHNLPGLTLDLIGKPGTGANAWMASLHQSSNFAVRFNGPAHDLPARLEELGIQINLVPSRWDEPFGLAAIEGMAASCITIVSGRGGLAEIAERTGALIAADAVQISAVLAQLVRQAPEQLAARARAQYDAAQAAYAPARFEGAIRNLLAEVCAELDYHHVVTT